jgi:phosphatidylglycerophosphatase C
MHRHPARAARLLATLPALLRFVRHRDHGDLKAAFIRAALGGRTRVELDAWTDAFVPRLLGHGVWQDALARIAAHHARGDTLVLMSASVDLYVPAIGRALGFTETLCTPLAWNGERLDGALAGVNLRGAAKARALKELRARYPGLAVTAYGNAASDLGHLCLADHGVLVNGSARTRQAAALLGIGCQSWR